MDEMSIVNYLLSTCLFMVDEFNQQYKGFSLEALEEEAACYSEADLVVRIGYPFRGMANFIMQTPKGKRTENGGNDIVVKSKDFRIEVKYIKTYASDEKGTRSNKTPWALILNDFEWLTEQIKLGKKDKRAFIVGWFNCTERFSEQLQIGGNEKKGSSRTVDIDKINYFPFLNYDPKTRDTKSVSYRFDEKIEPYKLSIPGSKEKLNCIFIGQAEDKFHFAIYY